MRLALSAMNNKTDRNDAQGIAQMMRMGWFRPVHVKAVETHRLVTFLANRRNETSGAAWEIGGAVLVSTH